MSFIPSANRGAGAGSSRRRITGRLVRQARIRLGAGAAATAALATTAAVATAAALALAVPAASASSAGRPAGAARRAPPSRPCRCRPMPAGTVSFGRAATAASRCTRTCSGSRPARRTRWISAVPAGPGSSGSARSPPAARPGRRHPAQRLRRPRAARQPPGDPHGNGERPRRDRADRRTRRLRHPGRRPRRLIAVEVSPGGVSYGTPRGRATISYNAARQTLTVTVTPAGSRPGRTRPTFTWAAARARARSSTCCATWSPAAGAGSSTPSGCSLTSPRRYPAHGWYLNIHQGNSGNILSNGQPTIYLPAAASARTSDPPRAASSVSAILGSGDVVTGVRAARPGMSS